MGGGGKRFIPINLEKFSYQGGGQKGRRLSALGGGRIEEGAPWKKRGGVVRIITLMKKKRRRVFLSRIEKEVF